jgi:ectoine hydroxylase-related dioxygenase (phytanoyl-CoA dioxygenase family)
VPELSYEYFNTYLYLNMKSIVEVLKKFKPVHWLYNLLHYKSLLHNKQAFKQHNIHKPLFTSISSKDFPDKKSQAWLDVGISKELAPHHPAFTDFSTDIQEQIINWSDNGFILLKSFFDDNVVHSINKEIDRINQRHLIKVTPDNKLPFANKISSTIKNITYTPQLISILNFLLGKEVIPFQTLNFVKGSNQRAHSDSIHMTTYPLGYLIAVWIALEDTNESNGPLFYYPGSHKLPYLLNNDFNETSTILKLGKKDYSDYEDVVEEIIQKNNLEKKIFYAKKGDALIWHANLIHGGSPIINHSLTRKSMVIHYYAKDVIKYHEITERPSLMK